MDQDPETFMLLDVKSSQDNMLRRIFGKDYRQKVLAHLNVEIGEIQFSIGLYNYTRLAGYYCIEFYFYKVFYTFLERPKFQKLTI